MLNSRKSYFIIFLVVNEKQGESSYSLSTVKQNMKTHISWLSKTFVEES